MTEIKVSNNLKEETMQTAEDKILQFFKYKHLSEELQEVSVLFSNLANHIVETLTDNLERHMALRKLLEAKDCAVRAKLYVVPLSAYEVMEFKNIP